MVEYWMKRWLRGMGGALYNWGIGNWRSWGGGRGGEDELAGEVSPPDFFSRLAARCSGTRVLQWLVVRGFNFGN